MNRWKSAALLVLMVSSHGYATELLGYVGGGAQPSSEQVNRLAGVDAIWYDWQRSPVQRLSFGSSVSYLSTDARSGNKDLIALSVFPELKLFTRILEQDIFLQVRALGPTWLSEHHLGDREQAMHFAFLAQIGGGWYLSKNRDSYLTVFYRHYSNANLKQPNDGLDVVFNVGFGYQF
ncbi:acyloxyacyl hydrolase [Agarivorans sp. QJM3NY_33]|uniref:acyloxyacyl hydrolase n=1 Tax=Agarivorans sp. QJM3NY_33 TaxID=3421432 RepID=UPI003D7C5CA4